MIRQLLKRDPAPPPELPLHAAATESPALPPRDLAADIAAMRKSLEEARTLELAPLRQGKGDAESRIKAATEFVQRANLYWPIIHVIDEMYYWPSWLNNPAHKTSEKAERMGFAEATGSQEKIPEMEARVVRWRFTD
jgi:hypothetical protein